MNPLQRILEWYNLGDSEIRPDFVALVAHFHSDKTIESAQTEEAESKFIAYLQGASLSDNEVVQRTLFAKGLIGFALDGRDTEEGWDKTMKLHQMVEEKAASENPNHNTELYDRMRAAYPERKRKWLEWSATWHQLLQGELKGSKIADWYFFESPNSAAKSMKF